MRIKYRTTTFVQFLTTISANRDGRTELGVPETGLQFQEKKNEAY